MKPIYTKNRTIGLLGGSFNPAHAGHLQLSLVALKQLKLDEVWWLVSPRNPLKESSELAPYARRVASARAMARHPKINVSAIEELLGTRYSIDTVRALKRRFPRVQFVWMMGADNLANLHRWKKWQAFCVEIPIAVFDRAPFSHTAQRSKAYLRNKNILLKNNNITKKWPSKGTLYIHMRLNPLSSTLLRKNLEK